MIAIDANVLLRLIVQDDQDQLRIARTLLSRERLFVPLTVVMECEWVLRSFYKFTKADIALAIDAATDLDGITFEDVDGVRWALGRMIAGADFADMIHIVQGRLAGAVAFATFDGGIETEAGDAAPLPIETLA